MPLSRCSQYVFQFWKSLNQGPVKLREDSSEESQRERRLNEAQVRAVKMMQRGVVLVTLLIFGSGVAGWFGVKRMLGVGDAKEFGEAMKEHAPQASSFETVGRRLQTVSQRWGDAISSNEWLIRWRRNMRERFNDPEGAKIARENSLVMAERRVRQRIARRAMREAEDKAEAEAAETTS
mmetsp:Transcript_48122/g.104230  ORF Transcript_48122/g.104230 Transcript_48122/m.104230 type:complete len:179 (-) Transcript_48122:364-900(-)